MSDQHFLAVFGPSVVRSPVGSFLVVAGPANHSLSMACVSGEKGVASSSLSCVCLSVMRWLACLGGLLALLFSVPLLGTWGRELRHILRLMTVLPFLHDWSQLQLQFVPFGVWHFIDLNAMLELSVAAGLSSAKWSIARLLSGSSPK